MFLARSGLQCTFHEEVERSTPVLLTDLREVETKLLEELDCRLAFDSDIKHDLEIILLTAKSYCMLQHR